MVVELKSQEKRRYVANLFSRISPRYDLMNALMTFGMHSRWRKRAARQAMEGLEGPVLDVATGTGDLALELGRVPGVTEVVGMDLLHPMVSRAVAKAARRPECLQPYLYHGRCPFPPFSGPKLRLRDLGI